MTGLLSGEAKGKQSLLQRWRHNILALSGRIPAYLVRNRQMTLIFLLAFLVVIEIIEQILAFDMGEEIHLYYDGIIFFIVIPIVAWLLLKQLLKLDVEREQAQLSRDLHTQFSQKLGEVRTWDELVLQIVTYPQQVAPRAEVTLFVLNPNEQRMQPEIACGSDGRITKQPDIATNQSSYPAGSLPQFLLQEESISLPAEQRSYYDLPIIHNNLLIGMIRLKFQHDSAPTADQIRALKGAAPVMALALEGALLQKMAADQAAASETQRQEIAQTLHDTLAQNVGYLRLKLDQLTGENAIREIGAVLQELERMRSTADEAYQQVRNTLDELNPSLVENLVSTLFLQARTISRRAGFNLRTSQVGKQHSLPTVTSQQILYIIREALYNVEKHARAREVHLQFLWLECELIIKVTDDGVGFNPRDISTEGHYGLWIMQQRAQEINGTLKITPAADGSGGSPGTEVTLWVPCPATSLSTETLTADPMFHKGTSNDAVNNAVKQDSK